MQGLAVAVDITRKRRDSAFKMEGHLSAGSFINQLDGDAAGNESHFPEPLGKCFKTETGFFQEDGAVVPEGSGSSGFVTLIGANRGDFALRNAFFIALEINFVIPLDRYFTPFRKRVNSRNANTVQAAGDFIAASAKLAAGMQYRHNNL